MPSLREKRRALATRLINQGMPIHSLRKLLGHQHLNTTQIYARVYDQTLHEQFQSAMSRVEAGFCGIRMSPPPQFHILFFPFYRRSDRLEMTDLEPGQGGEK